MTSPIFQVTDDIFNEFKAFIKPDKFEYDKVCEQQLATLRKTATAEGYMNDSTTAVFDRLEAILKHDLDHDLDLHRRDISYLIGQEIMDRLYYQHGQVQHSIKDDEYLDAAKKMFDNPGEYARILNIPAKKEKVMATWLNSLLKGVTRWVLRLIFYRTRGNGGSAAAHGTRRGGGTAMASPYTRQHGAVVQW